MDGGDLEGGIDPERNAEIAKLKKIFYDPSADDTDACLAASTDDTDADLDASTGLLRNLPLARFNICIMPHQQATFNIFQPGDPSAQAPA